jgi:uncharacterized protein (TIGR00369 family)
MDRSMNTDEIQPQTLEVREEVPGTWGKFLGLRLIRNGTGQATVEFQVDHERHGNPMGTVHGGLLCEIADSAMGLAYASTMAPGESFTTLELKINFLRPLWKAKLSARAKVVHAGRTAGLLECDVTDEHGRLVARASSTCMTLRGLLAEGREVPAGLRASPETKLSREKCIKTASLQKE